MDGVPVELHFMPGIMNNVVYNRRLQRWFKRNADLQCSNVVELPDGAGEIAVPTMVFNVIYQLGHLYHHFFDEGIGMRQIIDYYFVINDLSKGFLLDSSKEYFSNHPVPLSKEDSTSHPSPLSSEERDVAGDAIALPEFWYRQRSLCPQGAADDCLTQQSCDCLCGVNRLAGEAAEKAVCGDAADILSRVKVMSIQWLTLHYQEMKERPSLIVIDEAHHAVAKTYAEVMRAFPKAKKLGLTATPYRLKGEGFMDLFDTLLTSWSMERFIAKGRLSLYDYYSIKPDGLDQRLIDSLKKRGADGDYQQKELNEVMDVRPSLERLCMTVKRYVPKDVFGESYWVDGISGLKHYAKPVAEQRGFVRLLREGDWYYVRNIPDLRDTAFFLFRGEGV